MKDSSTFLISKALRAVVDEEAFLELNRAEDQSKFVESDMMLKIKVGLNDYYHEIISLDLSHNTMNILGLANRLELFFNNGCPIAVDSTIVVSNRKSELFHCQTMFESIYKTTQSEYNYTLRIINK